MATDATTIPSVSDLQQAKKDVTDISTFVKSSADNFVDNYGGTRKTITGIENEAEAQRNSIDALAAAQREDIYEKVTPSVKGTFEAGFTFENLFERGKFGTEPNETYWAFTGGSAALPYEVPELTDPSAGGPYEQVTLNVASDVSVSGGGSVQGYIDKNLTPFNTVAEMRSYDYSSIPEFSRIEWQGYYAQSDGGSNWGVLKKGDSTSLIDDGGSIFIIVNDAVNGVWIEANHKGKVLNVLKWGVDRTGLSTTNNSTAFMKVLTFAKANTVLGSVVVGASTVNSLSGGTKKIKFPNGAYRFVDSVGINSFNGLKITGDGQQTTTLIFDNTNSTFLNVTNYLNVTFENMTIMAASVTDNNGKPNLTVAAENTRTNTCFNFDSTGGGTKFYENNIAYVGWDDVYRSTTSTVNGDNHIHNRCTYRFNDLIWENTNDQAVIWEFNNCQIHFNEVCFRNPATQMFINGGDMINGGDFIVATGIANLGGGSVLTNVKFENYQNIDPSRKPRFLVLASGSYDTITFKNCSDRAGGGTLAGSECFSLAGNFKVYFDQCYFSGDINTDNSQSLNRVMSEIHFKNMKRVPKINQTLSGGQGNKPINVIFEKSIRSEGLPNSYIDRVFGGELINSTPLASSISTDVISMQKTINNSSAGHEFNAFCIAPYLLNVVGAKIHYTNNTANDFTLTLWRDATKTTKVFEAVLTGANSTRKSRTIEDSEIFSFPAYNISESSPDMFLEVSSGINSGTITLNCHLELASFV